MNLQSPPPLPLRRSRPAIARFLAAAVVITGLLTLLVLAAPWLVVLGFVALVLPGLILSAVPTVFLYTSIFSAIWFAVRANQRQLAVPAGLAAALLFAYALPSLLNKQTSEWLQESAARNKQSASQISQAKTVTIEEPARIWSQGQCHDLCQLLLYNGVAERVILIPQNAPEAKRASLPGKSTAYRIDRQPDCSITAGAVKLSGTGWVAWSKESEAIAKSVRLRIATGECLVAEPAITAKGDITIRRVEETIGRPASRFGLWPGPVEVRGVEVRIDDKVAARETALRDTSFAVPLYLHFAMGGLDRQWWEWGRRPATKQPDSAHTDSPLDILKRLENFDLSTPQGADVSEIRRRIDEALDDPQAPNGAFILAEDYFAALRVDKPGTADFRRLVRMIGDDRMTSFSYYRDNPAFLDRVGAALRDPILGRLVRQAQAGLTVDYTLIEIAARLPKGIYSGSVPLLDSLLANPIASVRAARLIPRLAEQGQAGAVKLWAIVAPTFETDGYGRSRPWQRDSETALEALCSLGPDAQGILPFMRRTLAAYPTTPGSAAHLLTTDPWRKTMVAMGADPTEFIPPDRNWKDPAAYHAHLRTIARKCAVQER